MQPPRIVSEMSFPEFDVYRTELCGLATDDWTELQPTFTFASLPSASREKESLPSEKSRYRLPPS